MRNLYTALAAFALIAAEAGAAASNQHVEAIIRSTLPALQGGRFGSAATNLTRINSSASLAPLVDQLASASVTITELSAEDPNQMLQRQHLVEAALGKQVDWTTEQIAAATDIIGETLINPHTIDQLAIDRHHSALTLITHPDLQAGAYVDPAKIDPALLSRAQSWMRPLDFNSSRKVLQRAKTIAREFLQDPRGHAGAPGGPSLAETPEDDFEFHRKEHLQSPLLQNRSFDELATLAQKLIRNVSPRVDSHLAYHDQMSRIRETTLEEIEGEKREILKIAQLCLDYLILIRTVATLLPPKHIFLLFMHLTADPIPLPPRYMTLTPEQEDALLLSIRWPSLKRDRSTSFFWERDMGRRRLWEMMGHMLSDALQPIPTVDSVETLRYITTHVSEYDYSLRHLQEHVDLPEARRQQQLKATTFLLKVLDELRNRRIESLRQYGYQENLGDALRTLIDTRNLIHGDASEEWEQMEDLLLSALREGARLPHAFRTLLDRALKKYRRSANTDERKFPESVERLRWLVQEYLIPIDPAQLPVVAEIMDQLVPVIEKYAAEDSFLTDLSKRQSRAQSWKHVRYNLSAWLQFLPAMRHNFYAPVRFLYRMVITELHFLQVWLDAASPSPEVDDQREKAAYLLETINSLVPPGTE